MNRFKKIFWQSFFLVASIIIAATGILSLFTGELIFGGELGSVAIRKENPIEWAAQTALTFLGSLVFLYLFFYTKRRKNKE